MTPTNKTVSIKATGQPVPAAEPNSDESNKDNDGISSEQNGLQSPERIKRSQRTMFSFAIPKSKALGCKKTYLGGKKTATSTMKIIGTTQDPSNERAALSRNITTKSTSQFDPSKQTIKAKNSVKEKQQTTDGTTPSGITARNIGRGETKNASSDSKREKKKTDRKHSSKRSTKKPLISKKTSETYAKINPIVDYSKDSETNDRDIRIIRCTSKTSSVGDFSAWERAAISPLDLFFAKSNEDTLAPKVLFDEESFYEGSFDEEFLSEDNEKLERCRILEERVCSRLQKAVDQDDTGSIVSLDGIGIFDLPDDESDTDTDSQTRTGRFSSKQSSETKTADKTVSMSRRRFDFEKAKPMFVSPWKPRPVESRANSEEKVEATQEARMSSLRKLFRRKSRSENQRPKEKSRNKVIANLTEKALSTAHHPSHREVNIMIETRSEEPSRSERRDMGIPEDREEEQDSDSEHEFLDDFPFDSCYVLSCQ